MNNRRQFVLEAVNGVALLLGLTALASSQAFAEVSALPALDSGNRSDVRYNIPPTDGVQIDTKNDVIIARSAGNAYAFALACPHQSTMLRWNNKDQRFQCPKHQSKYAPSGEFLSGRATRNMDRLPIHLDGGALVVDITQEIRSDSDAARWAQAVVKLPA